MNGDNVIPPRSRQTLSIAVQAILLLSIVVSSTILGLKGVMSGDAIVGVYGLVATATASTTAYRVGAHRAAFRRTDVTNGDE